MGDRTYGAVTIYACPPEQVAAALLALDQHSMTQLWCDPLAGPSQLELGAAYAEEQMSCGGGWELAELLMGEAPGAVWEIQEDPRYEWLGAHFVHTPELGLWSQTADADGQPVWHESEVRRLLEQNASDPVAVDRALGGPWTRAITAVKERLQLPDAVKLLDALDEEELTA